MTDNEFLEKTFILAQKGNGQNWPNPLVGCVIVKNGRIIGEGYHKKYGSHHAEIEALNNCTESPEGASVYVNLEPCCHTNKQTPPCAQRLIQDKVKRVIISNLDPNPLVNGKGVEVLRAHGIEVEHGILKEKGELLNEVFFHAQNTKLPFIHLKMAQTLDGKIALPTGESKWITGEEARGHVHKLRSTHQAIMIGASTLRKDDPKLNVRLPDFQSEAPYRVVFTESGNLPMEAQLFTDELREKTLIYTMAPIKIDIPPSQVIKIANLKEALLDLYQKKIINLFLEGGPNLATQFLKEGLVNRVSLYLNPSFLGSGASTLGDFGLTELSVRPRLKNMTSEWLADDLYLSGRLV